MNDYQKGAKSVFPILAGLFPFGLIYGISAASAGLTNTSSIAMSFIVFAGAAQMSLVNSFTSGTSVLSAVAIAALINLRMAMYGASIARNIRSKNPVLRIIASFLLTDQAYAVTIAEISQNSKVTPLKFYLGAAIPIWFTWQTATITGVLVGKTIPSRLSLEYAIPLTFLALLGPFLKNRYFIASALISGGFMILTRNFPYNSGFFISVFTGIAAGYMIKTKIGNKDD